MKKIYFLKNKFILLLFFIIFQFNGNAQVAKIDINGNFTVNGYSGMWWDYQYKPTGSVTVSQSPIIQGSGTSIIRLNPFIAWDFSERYYYSGQPGPWGQFFPINSDYAAISKSVGYNFNFDTSAVTEGWRGYRLQNTTVNTNSNIVESSYLVNGTGGKSIYMGWNSGYELMLVSPRMTDLATDKKFSIYARGYQGNFPVVLGTITNPYDSSTFHPLKTITLTSVFTKVDVFLNNYNGQDQYIAIKNSGNTGEIYLDDFSYEQSVNCFDLTNVAVSNISEHKATISYTSNTSSSYEVNLKNLRTGEIKTYNTTNTSPFEINDLVGTTNYEIKIRGNCATGLYTNWSQIINFSTPCDGVSNGYYTTFGEENNIDPCWIKIVNSTTIYNTSPYIYSPNLTITTKSGSKMVQIAASSSTSQKGYLVSPYVSDLDNNKRIKFYLTSSNGNYIDRDIIIGTMSNPNDDNTFVPLKTISPSEINQINGYKVNNYLKEHIVYFNDYNATLNHHYIALKVGNTTNSFNSISLFIDDFRYENIPSCKEPTDLKCLRNEVGNVVLKWNDFDSASTEWELEYGLKGFTIGSGTRINIHTNPYALTTNLLDKVDYEFYVRTKCGSVYSNWSDVGSFKSKCNSVGVGYVADFENEGFDFFNNTCWSRITPDVRDSFYSPNSFVRYQTAQSSNGIVPVSGTSMMEIFSYRNYIGQDNLVNEKSILVSPKLDGLNSEKKISFFANVGSDVYSTITRIEVGTLSDIQDYTTFTPYEIIDTDIVRNQWKEYTVDFSRYRGTNQYVGIRVFGTNSSNLRVFIDDFKYLQNNCSRPSNLTAKQSGANSATLSWDTNNNNPVNCEIEYGSIGFTLGTGTLVLANNLPFVINNLNSNTKYQYRVRNICSNNTINWSNLYDFKISCSVSIPFEENFDQYPATNGQYIPGFCWTINENSNENIYGGVREYSFTNFNSSPNSGYLYNSNAENKPAYFISPYLSDFDNTKRVKFWVNKTNNNSSQVFTIGTLSNPLDLTTFTPYQILDTQNTPTYGKELNVDFTNYSGTNKFIALKLTGSDYSNTFYIDDFKYLNHNTCLEPINVQVLNISNNSALVKWDNTNGENVVLEYGISGFTQGTGTIVNNNLNEVLITNLLPSTEYNFYLKTTCTSGQSITIGAKKFTTTCDIRPLPWLENFSNMPQYGNNLLPACFSRLVGGTISSYNTPLVLNTTYYSSDHTLNGNGDSTYLWINSFSGPTGNRGIISPNFSLIAGTTYTFNLDARKAYQYDSQALRMYVGRGNMMHYMEAELSKIGVLSEYNYNTNSFTFTPIASGIYSFILEAQAGGSTNMSLDNFELKEGYTNVISNNNDLFDFQNGTNNKLIVESTQNNLANIQSDVNNSANKLLKMSGGNSSSTWKSNSANIWESNQNYITKVNMKINASTMTNLFMLFDLKQTFNDNSDESMFRVVVNGNVIANVIRPNSTDQDAMTVFQYDLTPYVGTDIRISLQHIGKLGNNIGDSAYLDNLKFSPTPLLSTNDNNFIGLKYYPNPVSNMLNIENNSMISNVEITSVTGQSVFKENYTSNKINIDTKILSSGIYFIKITSDDKNKIIKIVKE
jgi:hypothetical protein